MGGWVVGASLYASVPIEIFDHRPTFRARLMSFFQLNGFTAIHIGKCGTVYFMGAVCYMFPLCMGTITLTMQKKSNKLRYRQINQGQNQTQAFSGRPPVQTIETNTSTQNKTKTKQNTTKK